MGEAPWFIHRHAYLRMLEMGLTRAAVVEALEDPEATWTQKDGMDCYRRGGIIVRAHARDRVVITIVQTDPGYHEREPRHWLDEKNRLRQMRGAAPYILWEKTG
jgi:hypothetical protein